MRRFLYLPSTPVFRGYHIGVVPILDLLRPELIDLKGSMVDPDPIKCICLDPGLTLMDPIGSRADSNLLRTGPDSEPIY